MKRLILVRHATAVDKGPEGSDFHRRLKKRGRREALLMAERVAPLVKIPDQVYSSPADRALETARVFAEHLGVPSERVALREDLYGGLLPEEFLHIVQRFDNRASSVMVFGHDPSFTEFAAYMIPGFRNSIPKAGVLVMDMVRTNWRSVRAGDARVVHFERPPAPDVQKRMDEDALDRLVVAIRAGILSGIHGLNLGNSREVTRLIARMSTRLARDLRPFVRATTRRPAAEAPSRGRERKRSGKSAHKTGKVARSAGKRPRAASPGSARPRTRRGTRRRK
ncbi:MAG TPA: histidine phosphatase family protein [Candidatus Krumholzibacteria bacterium]|nr:histidine phosphatase family protein [Candidatus Krumholzibacteria bacterium]